MGADIFISYSSLDRSTAVSIADRIAATGKSVWLDRTGLIAGVNWSQQIVAAIRDCSVLVLLCSSASLRSHNVHQEVRLAWGTATEKPKQYLPVMLEDTQGFPDQIRYFLEGAQWIDARGRPIQMWMPELISALDNAIAKALPHPAPESQWRTLRGLASFTERIWPMESGAARDLGEVEPKIAHSFPLGTRIRIAIDHDLDGHMLLIDEGTSGRRYCLCPSIYAPSTRVQKGLTYLPQSDSPYSSFTLSGARGREHLLALTTAQPLPVPWLSNLGDAPHVLDDRDVGSLVDVLQSLPPGEWNAMSTYFDVI